MARIGARSGGAPPRRFAFAYCRRLFLQSLLQILVLAVAILGIFLAERSLSILNMIIDEPVSLMTAIPLLALSSTDLYLAVPLVVLIGVYLVVLRSRERRELVVLASSGQSMLPLSCVTAIIGLLAGLFSLMLSGYVNPKAQYAFRVDRELLRYAALFGGGSSGRFYQVQDYSIYVLPRENEGTARPIFIRQKLGDGQRVITADRAEIAHDPQSATVAIELTDAVMHTFAGSTRPVVAAAQDPACSGCIKAVSTVRIGTLTQKMNIAELGRIGKRGSTLDEWTTAELLGWAASPRDKASTSDTAAEVGDRVSRALLCFFAPFLAWLAVSVTSRRTLIVALPLCCGVLLGIDVALSRLSSTLAAYPGRAGWVLGAIAIGLIVLMGRLTAGRQDAILRPALARS